MNILPYLPKISEATISREVFFSDYKGVLLSDIVSVQDTQYHHIFLVFKINSERDFSSYPIKCYASEWNKTEGEGVAYLGSFTEELQQPYNAYHFNYGENEELKGINYFFGAAMGLVKKDLNLELKSIVSIKIKEDVINDANIRSKEDILKEYNISEDYFDIKYKSYEHVFNVEGHPQDGKVGMFDYNFHYDFQSLNADERLKAHYSTHQSIINRVITALDHEKLDVIDREYLLG